MKTDYSRAVGALMMQAIWTEGGMSAEDLEDALGLKPDAVAARLQAMLDAGLLVGVQEGNAVIWAPPIAEARELAAPLFVPVEAAAIDTAEGANDPEWEARAGWPLSAGELLPNLPGAEPSLPPMAAEPIETVAEVPQPLEENSPQIEPEPEVAADLKCAGPGCEADATRTVLANDGTCADFCVAHEQEVLQGAVQAVGLAAAPPVGEPPAEETVEEVAAEDAETDEDDEEGQEDAGEIARPLPGADRSKPLFMDVEEGKYNARDVLGMCRVYPILLDHLDRTNTAGVYLVDRQLAQIALEMSRTGLPVDQVERERVGKRLKEIRDSAVALLRPLTDGDNRPKFIEQLAGYAAAKPRKKDPMAGVINEVSGAPHSIESAYMARIHIRTIEIEKAIDKKGVNFGAKLQQAAMLRVAGVPLLKVTEKTKQPKISKETLEEVAHHAPARAMLEFILSQAAIVNYIDGRKGKNGETKGIVIDPDDRLRPDWPIHKITGRWGSSPNVQNWSKRAGGGVENLRRMIAAPPGYKLVGADFAQIEARIIAVRAACIFLINVFARKEDIHGALAGEAFVEFPKLNEVHRSHKGQKCGISADRCTCGQPSAIFIKGMCPGCGAHHEEKCDFCLRRDKLRDLTKRLEYGCFYGGAELTLWQSVVKDHPDTKIEHVRHFMSAMTLKMPELPAWRADLYNRALKDGELRSPILGRRQTFPMHRLDPTVAYNWESQSGGADLWALGAVEFDRRWPQKPVQFGGQTDARLIHNGHDSMMVLARDEVVSQVGKDIVASWSRNWGGVDFPLDLKVGHRWSEV
jgi:DNA polymerase I-like protein with 3'-5' exonuclease and polymerase domains